MNLKFEAQISTGNLKIYDENNMDTPLYEINVISPEKEYVNMNVTDKDGTLAAKVLYKEAANRKWLIVNDYTIDNLKTGEKINVKATRGQKIIIGDNDEMCLERSIRDRKMTLYKNGKLIMTLKCKTLIRNWLKGEYTAEILDDSYALTCVCIIAIALNVIFDEHNSTSYTV